MSKRQSEVHSKDFVRCLSCYLEIYWRNLATAHRGFSTGEVACDHQMRA